MCRHVDKKDYEFLPRSCTKERVGFSYLTLFFKFSLMVQLEVVSLPHQKNGFSSTK
jgi:hypothetical protein